MSTGRRWSKGKPDALAAGRRAFPLVGEARRGAGWAANPRLPSTGFLGGRATKHARSELTPLPSVARGRGRRRRPLRTGRCGPASRGCSDRGRNPRRRRLGGRTSSRAGRSTRSAAASRCDLFPEPRRARGAERRAGQDDRRVVGLSVDRWLYRRAHRRARERSVETPGRNRPRNAPLSGFGGRSIFPPPASVGRESRLYPRLT